MLADNGAACRIAMSLWRDILDSLETPLIAFSRTGRIRFMNQGAQDLVGSPANDAARRFLARNDWLARMVKTCVAEMKPATNHEAQLQTVRGGLCVRATVSPLMRGADRADGAVALIDEAAARPPASLPACEDFSLNLSPAGLAHEVKNPLTGIKGAAELLAASPSLTHCEREYCEIIAEGVKRIAALVEQVLTLNAPQRLRFEALNIHLLLHRALAAAGLHPRCPEGIRVEQCFDPSLPEVRGDPGALERVFLNLLRNAAEAVGPRGVINIRTAMAERLRLAERRRRERFLIVEIADSGRGLLAREFAQLFTPFFTTKPNGTGLGLVLSKRIIALHGGLLWAEPKKTLEFLNALGKEPADSEHPPDQGLVRATGRRPSRTSATAGGAEPEAVRRQVTFKVMLPLAGAQDHVGSPEETEDAGFSAAQEGGTSERYRHHA